MRSTKNTRAVVVGIFVFVGIAILIVTILTLGGQKKAFGKSIILKAVFDDVNGLQKGNNIWFSGVKIGTVKTISISENSMVSIEMEVDDNVKQYIHKDAKARISQEGLIGNRIITISSGSSSKPLVENGDILSVNRAVSPDEMMSTLQSNNKNILEITNNFRIISHDLVEGKGTAGKLLADESLFSNLQSTLAQFKASADNVKKITDDVAAYVAKFDRHGTLINGIVSDTAIIPSLKRSAYSIENVVGDMNDVVRKLSKTSSEINSSLNNRNAPAGMFLHDEATASDIKKILQNLQAATEKLNDNLEAMQHNFLLRGFFKKKAKNNAKQ